MSRRTTRQTYADLIARGRTPEQIRSIALAREDTALQTLAEQGGDLKCNRYGVATSGYQTIKHEFGRGVELEVYVGRVAGALRYARTIRAGYSGRSSGLSKNSPVVGSAAQALLNSLYDLQVHLNLTDEGNLGKARRKAAMSKILQMIDQTQKQDLHGDAAQLAEQESTMPKKQQPAAATAVAETEVQSSLWQLQETILQSRDKQRKAAILAARACSRSWIDLGAALSEISAASRYDALGYASLEDYAQEELGLGGAALRRILGCYQYLIEHHASAPLQISTVATLARVEGRDDVEPAALQEVRDAALAGRITDEQARQRLRDLARPAALPGMDHALERHRLAAQAQKLHKALQGFADLDREDPAIQAALAALEALSERL